MINRQCVKKKIKNIIAFLLGVSVLAAPISMGVFRQNDSMAAKAKKKAIMVSVGGKLLKPVKKADMLLVKSIW